MGSTRNEIKQSEETLSEAFTLELPTELNVIPKWTIKFPKNKFVLVYEVQAQDHGDKEFHTRYDVYIVSGKTGVSAQQPYHNRGAVHFSKFPDLKHWLIDTAAQMAVKKRVKKLVDTEETDED